MSIKIAVFLSIIFFQVSPVSAEELNSGFGIRFGDKGANYGLYEGERNIFNNNHEYFMYGFSDEEVKKNAEYVAGTTRKVVKTVSGFNRYKVSSSGLDDSVYFIHADGRGYKKNEKFCELEMPKYIDALEQKYGLEFLIEDDNTGIWGVYRKYLGSKDGVDVTLTCFSSRGDLENAEYRISFDSKKQRQKIKKLEESIVIKKEKANKASLSNF